MCREDRNYWEWDLKREIGVRSYTTGIDLGEGRKETEVESQGGRAR